MQTGNGLLWRLNYSLMDRYLLTGSVRRDGFSAFGQNNPFGVFSTVAAGWRISEEKFLKDVEWINNLKLRLSWGQTGNRDIAFGSRSTQAERLAAIRQVARPFSIYFFVFI